MSTQREEKLRVKLLGESFRLVTENGMVVEEVDRFLSALSNRGLSPRTVRAYAFDLLVLYRWLSRREANESRTVAALKQRDLQEFVRFERQANASPASINRRLLVTEIFYRFLTGVPIGTGDKAAIGVSFPMRHYKGRGRDRQLGLHRIAAPQHRSLRVKTPRTVVEPLSAEQARLLISSFKRYRDLSIAYLMLLCGLRSREVLSLKMGDVNFSESRLLVSGKGNKERVLPLPTLLVTYLKDYLRLERPSVCQTQTLFVVLQGAKRRHGMTAAGLRSLFRLRRRNEKKIENANPHRLRHTFGTDMARAGVRLPVLQKLMGHEDSRMTLRYINLSMADVAAEFQRAAADIQKRYHAIKRPTP